MKIILEQLKVNSVEKKLAEYKTSLNQVSKIEGMRHPKQLLHY
jgi:hypothetical protein